MTTLTNAMKTCPAIGGTTPNSGTFTDIVGSSLNVSGASTLNDVTATTVTGTTITGKAGTGTGAPVMVGKLSVNVTPVGNVGGGTDTLMSYTLPANSLSANGKGVRVTMWGYTSSNANAKQIDLSFGSDAVSSLSLATSELNYWTVSMLVFRYAAGTQSVFATIDYIKSGVGRVTEPAVYVGGTSQDETATILIKLEGQGTDDNDIVQNGMLVEFIN